MPRQSVTAQVCPLEAVSLRVRHRGFVLPLLAVTGAAALTMAFLPPAADAAATPAVAALATATELSGQAAGTGDLSVALVLALTAPQQHLLGTLAAGPLGQGLSGAAADAAGAARTVTLASLRPAAAESAAVAAFAARHGLTVAHTTSASVLLTGPAGTLADLFGATLATTPTGLRYARAALVVPAELQTAVSAAVGLDERPVMQKKAIPGGYTGGNLRSAYTVKAAGSTGLNTTVALLQFSGWAPSDLSSYASAAGITVRSGQITEIAVDGAAPHTLDGTGGDFEVALDAETVLATAPSANQRLYFAPNSTAYIVDAVNKMADDAVAGTVQVASTSWGACELSLTASLKQAYGTAIDRLVAAGATYYAAAGDEGSYDCSTSSAPDNRLSVDFPAGYHNTIAVGGTTLTYASATGWVEKAWGAVTANPGASTFAGYGSGGGSSADQGQPTYQKGLAAATTRLVPDVSADADPNTGLGIYSGSNGGWVYGGGTSMASPTWAGFTAAALSAGGRKTGLGNILSTLYAHPADFRDITTGNNGAYAAASGYDQVTGLGSANWNLLDNLLVGTAVK